MKDNKLIVIIGLPYSGKEKYGKSLMSTNDVFIKNDNYIVLNDFLKISNIIITNDELCDSKNRDILLNSVDTTYIEWVFFENDPAKAIKNYMDETINMNEHSDLNIISNILNLSAIYDIPKYSTKLKIKIYEEKE